MRMTPPLRGVWASAAAESASPKPATIAIFFSIMFAPTVQEYSDQRFDHSQRIGCKGGGPEFVKPGLPSGLAHACDDDVAADIRDGRLIRMLEKGVRSSRRYLY